MSLKLLRSALLFAGFFLLTFTQLLAQQTIKVTGRILDDAGNPVNGASVVVKGSTGKGVVASSDGAFSIDVSSTGTLVFSSSGFDAKEEAVNNRTQIDISLSPRAGELTDVVVIGYGSRQRKDLNGAVGTIKPREIEKSTALSPELAMQGQMAGVNVTSAGGNPTARPTIRIRGTSSINFSDPLYVIDGIPLVEGGAGAVVDKVNDPTRRGGVNLYTIINPNDIESISVLKDASAAAVYGVRAANGVVLVTTKSGKKGKVRVDLDISYTKQQLAKSWDVLNTQEYVDFYTRAYASNPDSSTTLPRTALPMWQAEFYNNFWNPSAPNYIPKLGGATYDWQNELVNDDAGIANYNLRVSGGSENTTYNFSAGYNDNKALFGRNNANRWSLSSNVTSKIGKYLETGLNIRAVQQGTHTGGGGGDLDVWKAAPWQKIYDPAGTAGYASLWNYNGQVDPTTDFNSVVYPSSAYGRQYVAYRNVFGLDAINDNKSTDQTFIGQAYLQIQPIAGLRIKGTVNGQQTSISNNGYDDFDRWKFGENDNNPFSGVPDPVVGSKPGFVNLDQSATISMMKALNVNYTKSIGLHNIDVLLDASEQEYKWTGNGAKQAVISNNPDLRYFSTTGKERGYYELRAKYALIGYLGRLSYNYNSKYYLEGVIRRDGSSRFAPGNKWGTFPSGAVSWRISQENFFKGLNFVNDLKIRASYGVLGNEQTTGGWAYLSAARTVPPSYNLGGSATTTSGVAFGTFANEGLSWEKLKTTSIGFDAILFKNTVTFTAEYYNKLTEDIIQTIDLTPSAGVLAPADINVANVKNSGFEFALGYNKRIGEVGFNANANFTTVKNRITKLYAFNTTGATAQRGNTYSLEIGYPIGYMYGYKVGGIFQSQKEIDDYFSQTTDPAVVRVAPGDIYFQDLFGEPKVGSTDKVYGADGKLNSNDQTYLGKTIPGYYYGFTLGADWKGFDVSVQFFGKGDVQKYNSVRAEGESMNGYGRNQFRSVLNAWTPTNTNTDIPRAAYKIGTNLRFSDRFIEDAGYLRLQNLQVGYNFPVGLLARTNTIQSLRLYVSAINVFTITDYTGLDPENDLYPTPRQLQVGIKAGF